MTLPTTPGALDGTPIDLEAIKARCDAATKGPWECWCGESAFGSDVVWWAIAPKGTNGVGQPDVVTVKCADHRDQAFVAAARMDVPNLVRRVEELEAQVRALCQPDASKKEKE